MNDTIANRIGNAIKNNTSAKKISSTDLSTTPPNFMIKYIITQRPINSNITITP